MNTAKKLTLGLLRGSGAAAAFSPLDISDLTLWLDAGDAATLFVDNAGTTPATGAGTRVGKWADKSGAGRHLTQSTTNDKPTLLTDELNGQTVVRFDIVADSLVATTTPGDVFGTTAGTVIVVMKQAGPWVFHALFAQRNGASSVMYAFYPTYSNQIYFDYGSQGGTGRLAIAQPAGWDDKWHIVELIRRADGGQTISVDGAQIATRSDASATISGTAGELRIGHNTSVFVGAVQSMLVYNRDLTADEITQIRAYYASLIGNVPYFSLRPEPYRNVQISGATGTIAVAGTSESANGTAVTARWNGASYSSIGTVSNRAYGGNLTGQSAGQGKLDVDIAGTVVSSDYVGVGDVFVVAGQSNALGSGTNNQAYSHATLKAGLYRGGVWGELLDPTGTIGGSVWPLVATSYLADQSRPCSFLQMAVNGSSIASWATTQPSYKALLAAAQAYGAKAVLWWQGEQDAAAGTTQAVYNAALDAIANDLNTQLGIPLIAARIQDCSGASVATVNAAINEAIGDNANVLAGPDLSDIATDDAYHLKTDAKLIEAAARWWAAMDAALTW